MLVLSRKVGERIIIGSGADAVVVVVMAVGDGGGGLKIRLGLEVPKDTPIWREEILPPGHPLYGKGAPRAD